MRLCRVPQSHGRRREAARFEDRSEVLGCRFRLPPSGPHGLERSNDNERVEIPLVDAKAIRIDRLDPVELQDAGGKVLQVHRDDVVGMAGDRGRDDMRITHVRQLKLLDRRKKTLPGRLRHFPIRDSLPRAVSPHRQLSR